MSVTPNYVPRGYKTVNVLLLVKDARKALRFYNRAFGAEITMQLADAQGKIVHAEMKIEDTIIMLAEEDESDSVGRSNVMIQIYTGDVEEMYEMAIMAGAKEVQPIRKHFYGDRSGLVRDPFGHNWIIATHVEDVTSNELHKRFNELYLNH